MSGQLSNYKTTDTLGKSQLDLIIMVFDGAISAFRSSRKAFAEENTNQAREHLQKARRFVVHLYTTLDADHGGEIAEQLSKLYSFIINQIDIIDATKDLNLIDDNINILDNVRQGWIDLKEQEPSAAPTSVGATAPAQANGGFTTSA